jgi:putative SOS response-associated peptidase YedK
MMCVNYKPLRQDDLVKFFDVEVAQATEWPSQTYQNYPAPIIRKSTEVDGMREAIIATYGMVPKQHIPSGMKQFSTMNARAETVGKLRSYKSAWSKAQFCLVPLYVFYEPNWET